MKSSKIQISYWVLLISLYPTLSSAHPGHTESLDLMTGIAHPFSGLDHFLVGLLARLQMKMTLPEVIAAYTYNSACALGLSDEVGTLELDKSADFISIEGDWKDLFYSIGAPLAEKTYLEGVQIA